MSSANAKRLDRLLRDIEFHNLQLRRLGSILLVDEEFLRFYDTVGAVERTLLQATEEEELHRFSLDSGTRGVISLIEAQVNHLHRLRTDCLRRIDNFNHPQQNQPAAKLKNRFVVRLKSNVQQLQQSYKQFRSNVLRICWHLGDIYHIAELQSLVAHTDHLAGVVRKNHHNCIQLLEWSNLQHTVDVSCCRLKFTVNSLLLVILVRFWELLDEMDDEEIIRGLHDKLKREIRQTMDDMQVNEDELDSLRQKLFPSTVSLRAQRMLALEKHELRNVELTEELSAIDSLERGKRELEGRVALLVEQREAVQRQLDERVRMLHAGAREIVRLVKLIEQIAHERSNATEQFQQQTTNGEKRRLEALQNENISTESRARLLAECDAELMERTKSHTRKVSLLEARRSELKRMSASLAQDVAAFRGELAESYQDNVAQAELRKQQASPSEAEQLDAALRQQRAEYEENLSMLDRVSARAEHPTADQRSCYSVTGTEELVAGRSSTEIMHEDESGTYHLDKFGKKIYHRQYFTDPQGKYYIDDTGTRIYTTTSGSEANFQSSAAAPDRTNETDTDEQRDTSDAEASETESMRDRRERVAADLAYIEHSVAKPVRKALAAVARAKPYDPVGYLSDYLALLSENAMEVGRRQQLLERVRKADEAAGCGTFPSHT